VAVELVAGLVGDLGVIFATFAKDVYHQTYTYDTGNNLTNLSHQANSSAWQQTIAIHPNNNRIIQKGEFNP
jgi:hypothetical protein